MVVGGGRWWWGLGGGGGGMPLEAAGGHRGQFPRTDFGLASQALSSNNAARTPKATLVWGINQFR